MQPHTIILLEGTLSLGLPLAWAFHELWRLRRDPPHDGPSPPALPRPLPPVLDAQPPRARIRVLEDA